MLIQSLSRTLTFLFKCGKFCANLKHSERLNSGVMVVEPSEEHFNDMVSKVTEPTVNHTDFKEASRTI
ncbi:putative glucuronosyltransferase [Helianthus anomalus]